MKIVQHGKKRKAISPVLATVILIAITLIAAIAVAGFVFGLFGSFTSSAQISAVLVTCHNTAPANCAVSLQNTGSSNATPTACSLQIAGVATSGTTSTAAVTAGAGAIAETCALGAGGAAGGAIGSTAQGSFTLSNGASVTFTGTWQV
ncbi:MAG: archaellin/type IV pilin N-terminal domain-containing protein [Nitrososphaerales archaeon]|jgi:flagellin-like protein